VQPDDRKRPDELWIDRNGDGKADVVFFDADHDGNPDHSLWDDEFNGRFAWRGEHVKGSWEPVAKVRRTSAEQGQVGR
jgi:hypothetical protein